jgi:Pentapeptide repeats (8 copies)
MGRKKPGRKKSLQKDSRWGFRGMTVRGWLELLIIPLVLVGIGLLFENQQANRQEEMEAQQQARQEEMEAQQQALEERRAKAEQELAVQRAQDEALQAYLDQMSSLILDKDRPLRQTQEGDEVRVLARARTLTILARLDPSRKTTVMQFLIEMNLISGREGPKASGGVEIVEPTKQNPDGLIFHEKIPTSIFGIIRLDGADLRGIELPKGSLNYVSFTNADLKNAYLFKADLAGTDLINANLSNANLQLADLKNANLNLADLRGANLTGATLNGASLRGADLRNAVISEEQLKQADAFVGATMPNGQTYEDWLKRNE